MKKLVTKIPKKWAEEFLRLSVILIICSQSAAHIFISTRWYWVFWVLLMGSVHMFNCIFEYFFRKK